MNYPHGNLRHLKYLKDPFWGAYITISFSH